MKAESEDGYPRMPQRSVKRSKWNRKGYIVGIWEERTFGGWGMWTDTVSQDV